MDYIQVRKNKEIGMILGKLTVLREIQKLQCALQSLRRAFLSFILMWVCSSPESRVEKMIFWSAKRLNNVVFYASPIT